MKTRTGETATLRPDTILRLRNRLRGALIEPDSAGYDEARQVYNAMHDRRPALIVQATSVADVIAAVRFARDQDLELAVRGGGHSVPGFGTCDGGIVLDLKRMKGIRVDPSDRTVRVEGGCTWGDLDHATHVFGLATTGGIVSTTGVAGLTLGGGMGYLARRCGLSCDNLVAADVVTADGSFVTCSEDEEQDLFWAIRGGGGNFGVVTSFLFRLHAVADVFAGPTFFALDDDVLRSYRDFIAKAPEELGAIFAFTMAPPLPFLPEKWHGKPVAAIIACWTGLLQKGQEILAPLGEFGEVLGAHVGPMPYPTINQLFDDLVPPGLQQYWKGNFVKELSDDAVEVHLRHAAKVPTIESGTFFFPMDGAIHRVNPEETAFVYRQAAFSVVISGAWPSAADNEQNIEWVRNYYDALQPYSEEGAYINFLSRDEQDRVRLSYGQNYDRLVQVKSKYDPTNLLCVNQNIQPNS